MLHQIVRTPALQLTDVQQYLLIQAIADLLEQPDVTELWKSAPYLLNFLDGYKLRARFDADRAVPDYERELAAVIDAHAERLLDRSKLARYDDIDPGAPRLRALVEDLVDTEAWRLLWIPPALPYHELGGAYARPELEGLTKRLVFSAWRAVPRSVAGLLSYLAERRFTLEADPTAVRHAAAASGTARSLDLRQRRARTADRHASARDCSTRRRRWPPAADPRAFATDHAGGTIGDLLTSGPKSRYIPLLDGLPRGGAPGPKATSMSAGTGLHPSCSTLTADWGGHIPIWAAEWTDWDKRASARGEPLAGARGARTLPAAEWHARSGARSARPGGSSRRGRQACGRRPGDARPASPYAHHWPSRPTSLDARASGSGGRVGAARIVQRT